MQEYQDLLEKLDSRRQELMQAQGIFDLPPTNYSTLLDKIRDQEQLGKVFAIYQGQKSDRGSWSKTLWADAKPQDILDGMDSYLKDFRKLPEETRKLAVARTLEASMRAFRNAIPLLVELKNDAMQERHWKELMEKAGSSFDTSPDRF